MYFSVHPDSRFYPGRLGTSKTRGPEQHPRWLYRVLFSQPGFLLPGTLFGNSFITEAKSRTFLPITAIPLLTVL